MSAATLTAAEAGCPFCKLVMERVTTGRGIEQIGSSGVYHFEPLNPVTPGHRLFIPAFHYEDAAEAPSATGAVFKWAAWWAAQQDEDFNLIVNAGPAASQTVRHLHIHYVPRRPSDGLILPWSSLAEKRAEWEAEQDTLPQCGYCGNNLRGLPGCPTHGAEQGETEWEYTTADFDGSPITDEMLGIMAQAFYEATHFPGSGIRYMAMTVKPEIVAGLRAALEAAEEARR